MSSSRATSHSSANDLGTRCCRGAVSKGLAGGSTIQRGRRCCFQSDTALPAGQPAERLIFLAGSRLPLLDTMGPMETPPIPARTVESWPCQSVCVWAPTGETWRAPGGAEPADASGGQDLRVFACAACGSEWVRTEAWTPIDAHGVVPEAVLAERRIGTRG